MMQVLEWVAWGVFGYYVGKGAFLVCTNVATFVRYRRQDGKDKSSFRK